jgi:tetratricopeptide (TPR) repeat protein/predicted nucleotidyltransferase
MNLENSFINSFIFTTFKELAKEKPSLRLGPYAEISLKIFQELSQQDLTNARGVCKEWKQLIEKTDGWKRLHSKKIKSNLPTSNQLAANAANSLDPSPPHWSSSQIAKSLWYDPSTIINDAVKIKVNAVATYLHKEGFELKGVASDGDCFFNAFLGSYEGLSRKIPLLDMSSDKIPYLRQVLSDMIKHTNNKRAEEIIKKGSWVSGLGEGDLLARALSIPIRLVTVNEDSLGCGINDMLISSKVGLTSKKDRSQEWETIPQEERPQGYIFIVDLGGHFIYAQKPLKYKESFIAADHDQEGKESNFASVVSKQSPSPSSTPSLPPGQWDSSQIAKSLWYNSLTIISESQKAKVNAVAAYLHKEGFELKGVARDGDCFFSAFLGSYKELSRKIPLLDEHPDKTSYLRQVLSDIVKHTDSKRAEEIKERGGWVSGLGEGDLLASALSIPIRLVTVNEERLICGINDMLIFPKAGLAEDNRSQEWETIPQEERPQEYIFIVDLGGHFIHAQKPLKQDKSFLSKSKISSNILFSDSLSTNELKNTLKTLESQELLSDEKIKELEQTYTQALQIAVQEKDPIQESFCIEELGDIYLRKQTSETLLQAAGLYNYALRLAPPPRQTILKDKLSQVQNLLARECKGKPFDPLLIEKQFERNRNTLKKFREEIEKKIQTLPENPSSQEVRELYGEIAHHIKIFFGQLVIQAVHQLDTEPCEYAMIGFGSLAREEMTPYSDLEFGILIQEDTPVNRKYFRNLTNLIHLQVINLGETILPALNIPCLKAIDFFDGMTPRGLAFDGAGVEGKGCKTPLGNDKTFELIQTPEKMAQYIGKDEKSQWWHEKEPHLPMELLNFTHLLGNKELTKAYDEKIQEVLNTSYQESLDLRQYLAKQHLVLVDMNAFNPGMSDLNRHVMFFQVKNDFYRFPHLALDRLALLKKVEAADTFTRIDKLSELKIITKGATERLKEWMSLALFMRLKTYSHYQAQQEMMNPLLKPFGFEDTGLIKQQFALDHKALKKIKKIYHILIPFYQSIHEFLAGIEDKLKSSDLNDNSPETQGDIALRLFQYTKAEKWYLLAKEANPQNAGVLNALAIIYYEQGNLERAAEYINKALAIDLKLFGEYHPNLPIRYNNLGRIYKEQGNLGKAEDYINKGLVITIKLFGKYHPDVATHYNNLGGIYKEQGNLGKAEEYIRKALAIDLKFFGEYHPNAATHYNNLGQIYQGQGSLQQAAEYTNKALVINLKLFGENHPRMANNYSNLGAIYLEQGNLGQAEEYINKALATTIKLVGEDHSMVAILYNNLGGIYLKQGNLDKAAEYSTKALAITIKLVGEDHSMVAILYNNLGEIYKEQGNLDKAAEYSTKALAIDLKLFGEYHPRMANNYSNLGAIYLEQGNLGQAEEYINKALAITIKLVGEDHPEVATHYNNLGGIYLKQGNLDKAAEYSTKALAIDLKLFGENHSTVAILYNNLGEIYKEQGNLDKAAEYSTKALAIDLKLFGEYHPRVGNDYNSPKTLGSQEILSDEEIKELEQTYTQALQIAVQEKDLLQESFCIEKLGDIYLRKQTSETLLQAAGLYNYALRLAPPQRQKNFKDKLCQVQNLLVKQCKGKPFDSVVMEKQFERNRNKLKKFREEIEKKIQALPEDPSSQEVRELYGEIAHQIKIFFGQLTIQALHQLDPTPCEYAMIGFGSLAREEMTPYSDLEFGILIQEDSPINKKYFRNLTNLLHLQVINLGETILPALNIPCLKAIDFFDGMTPRGLAFDGAGVEGKGCKTPLGNGKTFELIQTPEQMAQYLGKDEKGQWWHEKEPHLPMELLNFTHLLGNKELTEQYRQYVQHKLNDSYKQNLNIRHYLAHHHLVYEDMENFDPGMGNLSKQGMLFKVKNDFYRFPHLALDRLALLKKIEASDTFTRIDKLSELEIITKAATEKLKDWMNLALFMRLKTYSHYQAQQEMMNPLLKPFGFEDAELIQQQFALDHTILKKIKRIYRTFIPFYQSIHEFLAGNEDHLKSSDLEDNSPEAQGDIHRRLFQHKKAEKWYLLAKEANPENPRVLNALAIIYHGQGNLNKAAEYGHKALAINLKLFGENHPVVARDYNNLGGIYQDQGNLDKAEEYGTEALDINLKLFGENHPIVAIYYNNLGQICQRQGNLDKAEEYSTKALAINLKLFGENHLDLANFYNNLGGIYKEQGNLGKAAEYYNKALSIDLKLFGKYHPRVATRHNNLGKIYQEQGNLGNAENYINTALNIDLKLFGEYHPDVARDYNNLGQLYQEQGNLFQAEESINKALSIDLKLFGEYHPDVATRHNNLGQLYQEQGNLVEAEESINKALSIDLSLFGEYHPTIASNYTNLGQIYQEQGKLDKALEYSNKALAINLKLFGKNHHRVATCHNNLGLIYKEQGNLDKALEHIKKAIAIDLKLFGKNHPTIAINYSNLGLIYQEQGNLDNALEYSNKALAIDLKLFGENHHRVAIRHNNLGGIYKEQGNLDKALEYVNKALVIDLKLFGEYHPTMAINYSNLGLIYEEQGNLGKVLEYVNKALVIDLKLFGEYHPTVANCYNNLGGIYKEQGNLDQAEKYINKALVINLSLFGEYHPHVANCYNNLGQIYQGQGNLDKALEYSNKALAINLKLFGKYHPDVANCYNNLGLIYQDQGNLDKALEYSNKALAINLKLFGKYHPSVPLCYNNLGTIYQRQGNLGQAAKYIKKALAIDLKLFSENHPRLARDYNNLGAIYQEQGDLDTAEEYSNKALAINFKLLGENHPTMANFYNNLAVIYQKQGNLGKAANYTEKALIINFNLFGENHPEVAINYNNLGQLYKEQGNLDKAEESINKALTINLKLFGENHPAVAINYNNLGLIYQSQGNLSQAEEFINKALTINLNLFGENHPEVAINYNKLGQLYKEQGNLDKAEESINKALTINLKLFGENYPAVAINYNNLGLIYQSQGNLSQAEEFIKKALAIDLNLFGENHPKLAKDYNNLGAIYQEQGNLDKAQEYINKALTIDLKLFGEYHPRIAIYYNNLGQIYQGQGNLGQAEELINKALAIDLNHFGENHPRVVIYYNNLGQIYQDLGGIYQQQGNLGQTKKYIKKALAIALKLFNENHSIVTMLANKLKTIS